MANQHLEERLAGIRDFDVLGFLGPVIVVTRDLLSTGDLERAEFLIQEWANVLDCDTGELAIRARELESSQPYRAVRQRFSVQCSWMREGLASVHRAIMARARYDIERWNWIGAAYGSAVTRLLSEVASIVTTRADLRELRTRIARTQDGQFRVLRTLAGYRSSTAASDAVSPELRAHCAFDLQSIVDDYSASEQRHYDLLRRRDDMRRQVERSCPSEASSNVAALASLTSQIAAYEQLLERWAATALTVTAEEVGHDLRSDVDRLTLALEQL